MKPKYRLFSNASYALSGLKSMWQREMAFRIEVVCIVPLLVFSLFLEIDVFLRILIDFSLMLILIMECVNSAMEASIDLITQEIHPLAKIAKDCASGAVLLSVVWAVIIWGYVLMDLFL